MPVLEFFQEFFGEDPSSIIIGLGSVTGLLVGIGWVIMRVRPTLDWVRRGQKPRFVPSYTKNPGKDDIEIDPRHWINGESDRWCLMREQRLGDFIRLTFRDQNRDKALLIYDVTVESNREHGFPMKGFVELLRENDPTWGNAEMIEQEWSAKVVYDIPNGKVLKGIGFRISEPRRDPPGQQFQTPAWSISRIEMTVKRWRFGKREITIPW